MGNPTVRSWEPTFGLSMATKVKVFGRLRTKASHAGTRGPDRLGYGDLRFRVVWRDEERALMDARQQHSGRCLDALEMCLPGCRR